MKNEKRLYFLEFFGKTFELANVIGLYGDLASVTGVLALTTFFKEGLGVLLILVQTYVN